MNDTKKMNAPQGIGGWLLIPLLGLLASTGLRLADLFWHVPGTDVPAAQGCIDLHDTLSTVLHFAIVALHLTFMAWVLWLCHGRSLRFPKWMRFSLWLQLAFDAFVVFASWSDTQCADSNERTGSMVLLVWSIVWVVIWIPYFYRSRRVKATFINR